MLGQTISHYKIIEKLGQGGMGIVYKAEDTKLKREVAIKFLPQYISGNEEERKRFEIEAQAAASLNHPNITTIHSIEEVDDEMFIVMEYIEGTELKDKIKNGPISTGEAINIAIQIAEGLEAAHKKGIVHRDIKLNNIMVTESGRIKIMDFGMAKVSINKQTSITKQGTVLGTTAYMSPEQAQGKTVDHRSDIWSFGVVLYELITKELPFKSDYEQVVIYSILNEAYEPVSNLRTEIPIELEQIIDKILQKDPAARYQEMSSVKKDLQFINNKSISTKTHTEFIRKGPARSIIVLPFSNLSTDPENEYFCDGLAEELINALTKIEQLRVVARATAFSFKSEKINIREIGKKLNVETVLEGSVRKAGDRLRITVQLSQVSNGYQLWSEKYDRNRDDIFAVQDEITLTIVDKLRIKLLGAQKNVIVRHYTQNIEAYHLYLKGRHFGYDLRAIAFFEKAINKDPLYAPAYSGLSDIYSGLGVTAFLPPEKAFTKAKAAAEKALEIDDTLAEAYSSIGLIKFWLENDWNSAEQNLQRAIILDPGYALARCWFANLLVWKGEPERAISEIMQAQQLDPLSSTVQAMVGFIHYCARRFDEAIKHARHAIELNPDSTIALYLAALPYKEKLRYNEAISSIEKAIILSGRKPFFLGLLGHILGISGEKHEAHKILDELNEKASKEYVSPLLFAWLHLGLENNQLALEWFVKAYNEGYGPYHIFIGDSVYNGIRSAPQFKEILEKIGIGNQSVQQDSEI